MRNRYYRSSRTDNPALRIVWSVIPMPTTHYRNEEYIHREVVINAMSRVICKENDPSELTQILDDVIEAAEHNDTLDEIAGPLGQDI